MLDFKTNETGTDRWWCACLIAVHLLSRGSLVCPCTLTDPLSSKQEFSSPPKSGGQTQRWVIKEGRQNTNCEFFSPPLFQVACEIPRVELPAENQSLYWQVRPTSCLWHQNEITLSCILTGQFKFFPPMFCRESGDVAAIRGWVLRLKKDAILTIVTWLFVFIDQFILAIFFGHYSWIIHVLLLLLLACFK